MRVNAYSHLSMFEMCSSYTRCHLSSALNAVGAIGTTALNNGTTGFGVCSALGTACAAVPLEVPLALPFEAPLDSGRRVKSSACAGTPVCVQLPEISRPFFFSLPSYTPPTRGTSNRTASPRSVTLLKARTACWSTLSIVPPSSPLLDFVIVTTKCSCPPSTPAHTPSMPLAGSVLCAIKPAGKRKKPSAVINSETILVGILMCILRPAAESQSFCLCALCVSPVNASVVRKLGAPRAFEFRPLPPLIKYVHGRCFQARNRAVWPHRPGIIVTQHLERVQIQKIRLLPVHAAIIAVVFAIRAHGEQSFLVDPRHRRPESARLFLRQFPRLALVRRISRHVLRVADIPIVAAHHDQNLIPRVDRKNSRRRVAANNRRVAHRPAVAGIARVKHARRRTARDEIIVFIAVNRQTSSTRGESAFIAQRSRHLVRGKLLPTFAVPRAQNHEFAVNGIADRATFDL